MSVSFTKFIKQFCNFVLARCFYKMGIFFALLYTYKTIKHGKCLRIFDWFARLWVVKVVIGTKSLYFKETVGGTKKCADKPTKFIFVFLLRSEAKKIFTFGNFIAGVCNGVQIN